MIGPGSRARTILVVDGNRSDARVYEEARKASSRDLSVTVCFDAEPGLEALDALRPDLVLVDLRLPSMSGAEFVAAVRGRAERPYVPVVGFTSWVSPREAVAFYWAGGNGLVAKPCDLFEFLDRFRKVCDFWLDAVILPSTVGVHAASAEPRPVLYSPPNIPRV